MFNAIFALEPTILDRWRGTGLKALISNAAPLPQRTKEIITDYFGDELLHECYGSTEGGIVCNLRPRDQLRKIAVFGRWRALDREATYPTEFVEELTRAGFLSALIPEAYGGSGLPLRAAAVILEEINASGCVASQGHAQMYIMGTLLRHGSEAQKHKYLPEIAAGRIRLQAFGVTEPTTGSDTTQLKTRAVRDGDVSALRRRGAA